MPYIYSTVLPDDAYYYFGIARNIAHGRGVSFDGIEITNGFHPLWMLTLIPVFASFPGDLAIRVALMLCTVFNLVTALEIRGIVRFWCDSEWAATAAVGLYLLNPHAIAAASNGLETSLGVMLLGAVILARERLRNRPSLWRAALFGLTVGLLWLGRTDYVFICVLAIIDFGWQLWRTSHRWALLIVAALIAAVLVSPWIAWNLNTFGSPFQVSGEVYPTFQRIIAERKWGAHYFPNLLRTEMHNATQIALWVANYSGMDRLVVLIGPLMVGLLVYSYRKRETVAAGANLLLFVGLGWYVLLGTVLQLAVHFLYRWMWVPWYMAPVVFASAVYFGLALRSAWRWRPWVTLVLITMLIAGNAVQGYELYIQRKSLMAPQAESFPGTLASVNQMCQTMKHVGVTDSGYVGFYGDCTVTNLDGVVNNAAYEALLRRQFVQYLQQRGIEAVLLNRYVRAVLGEDELAKLEPIGNGWLRVPGASE